MGAGRRRGLWAVALTCVLALLAGAVVLVPRWRDRPPDLEPGLLTVAEPAQGRVLVAGELFVELFESGLRISRRGEVVWEGVYQGAFVGGAVGRLERSGGRTREVVDRHLARLDIGTRTIEQYSVTYRGRLSDDLGSVPVRLRVSLRVDGRIVMAVDAPGVDALVLHGVRNPTMRIHGAGEQRTTFDLAGRRVATTTPFYLTSRLTGLGVDTSAYSVLDLSRGGRADVLVWDDEVRARLYDGTSPRELLIEHTADSGRPPPLPDWALSGAVVEVPDAQVRTAVDRLLGAGARLAAVLVPDTVSPGTRSYLRERGLRLLRPGGPAGGCAAVEDVAAAPCLWARPPRGERDAARTPATAQLARPSTWDGLASAVTGKLSAGVSGAALAHSSVGGDHPEQRALRPDGRRDDELLARWAEVEALGPLLRAGLGSDPGAPQVWGSAPRAAAFARTTRLRAATAAYRQRAVEAAARTGLPVVRPVWLDTSSGRPAREVDEVLLGGSFLLVPVLEAGEREVDVLLPRGRWVDVWTGRTHGTWETNEDVTLPAPLGRPVLLYREGDPEGPLLREALRRERLL